jgi:hypothetical protein
MSENSFQNDVTIPSIRARGRKGRRIGGMTPERRLRARTLVYYHQGRELSTGKVQKKQRRGKSLRCKKVYAD